MEDNGTQKLLTMLISNQAALYGAMLSIFLAVSKIDRGQGPANADINDAFNSLDDVGNRLNEIHELMVAEIARRTKDNRLSEDKHAKGPS